MFRKILITVLAASALAATFGATAAQADDKALCKNGGFAQYVDPATEQPFTSQGQCVSFVAKGGTLVPVEEPVEEAPFVYTVVVSQYDYRTACTVHITGTGEPGSTHTIQAYTGEPGAGVFQPQTVTVGDDGTFTSDKYAFLARYPFTLTVDGEVNTVTCEIPQL